jgi:hypothetical protein
LGQFEIGRKLIAEQLVFGNGRKGLLRVELLIDCRHELHRRKGSCSSQ